MIKLWPTVHSSSRQQQQQPLVVFDIMLPKLLQQSVCLFVCLPKKTMLDWIQKGRKEFEFVWIHTTTIHTTTSQLATIQRWTGVRACVYFDWASEREREREILEYIFTIEWYHQNHNNAALCAWAGLAGSQAARQHAETTLTHSQTA